MGVLEYIATGIFVVALVFIAMEHKVLLDKAVTAVIAGAVLWILAALSLSPEEMEHREDEAFIEIFGILTFLGAAMYLVRMMTNHRLFDVIRVRLNRYNLADRGQFLVIGTITFFLSAVLDNLTITLVMVQVALRFFRGRNLLVAFSGIIILANAGGAWSPLGDVTTIMMWLEHKYTAGEIIRLGFLPSAAGGLVALLCCLKMIKKDTQDVQEEEVTLTRGEILVNTLAILSFSLPFFMHLLGLHPLYGLLCGLGIVGATVHFLRHRLEEATPMDRSIKKALEEIDHATLWFFLGILLAVSALTAMGVFEHIFSYLGEEQKFDGLLIGTSVGMGALSAFVDNVPLTALMMDAVSVPDVHFWVLNAITLGTGGSMLLIGSAAGVIAWGEAKKNDVPLNMGSYFKVAFIPSLLSYIAGIGVWGLQYWLTA